MFFARILLILSLAFGLSACGNKGSLIHIPPYTGPLVTSVIVKKEDRKLYLMHGNQALKTYDIELGFTPEGHKEFERDGKTPEGAYWIDRRNPQSQYHLSLGISYPNNADRAHAAANGRSPGGDIFIHGTPRSIEGTEDWTAGCIAVSNREVEEIWAMVRDGTPIYIYP